MYYSVLLYFIRVIPSTTYKLHNGIGMLTSTEVQNTHSIELYSTNYVV